MLLSDRTREFHLKRLRSAMFLRSFSAEQIASIYDASQLYRYDSGEVIIQEGTDDAKMYILLIGRVDVKKGSETIASIDRYGELFGEQALISRGPRTATVVSNGVTYCLVIDTGFLGMLSTAEQNSCYAVIYRLCAEILSTRLKATSEELARVKRELNIFMNVDEGL